MHWAGLLCERYLCRTFLHSSLAAASCNCKCSKFVIELPSAVAGASRVVRCCCSWHRSSSASCFCFVASSLQIDNTLAPSSICWKVRMSELKCSGNKHVRGCSSCCGSLLVPVTKHACCQCLIRQDQGKQMLHCSESRTLSYTVIQ